MYEAGGSGQTPSSPPPPGNMFPTLNNEIPLQQLPEEKYEDIGSWNTHGKNWSVDSSTGLQRCQRYFAKIYNNCAHLRIKKLYYANAKCVFKHDWSVNMKWGHLCTMLVIA